MDDRAAPAFGGRELGSDGPLVVFVHGVLDRGRSFATVAEHLAGECRMIWYDRRGYGTTAAATDVPVGVDGHAADLLTILDGRQAILAAHSFGGLVALAAAAAAPDQVAAVVLYESIVAWAPGWDDSVVQGLLADSDPEAAGLRLMLGDRYDAMDDTERRRRRVGAAAFIAEERSIRGEQPLFDLAAVRAPIIYGTSMPERTTVVTDHLRRHGVAVEVVVFPGSDHHAHRTAPAAFADLVRRAIRACPAQQHP